MVMRCVQTALAAPSAVFWPCARTCSLNRKTPRIAKRCDLRLSVASTRTPVGTTRAKILADHRGPRGQTRRRRATRGRNRRTFCSDIDVEKDDASKTRAARVVRGNGHCRHDCGFEAASRVARCGSVRGVRSSHPSGVVRSRRPRPARRRRCFCRVKSFGTRSSSRRVAWRRLDRERFAFSHRCAET